MITPALVTWAVGLLEHPTTGLNALRAQVPRGALPVPPAVVVFDAVSDNEVARRAPPEPTPAEWVVHVSIGESVVLAGAPNVEDFEDEAIVVFHLAGATAASNNAGTMASAWLLMRCLRRCLFQGFRAVQASDAARLVLDQQRIGFPERIPVRTQKPEPGSGRIDIVAIAPFTLTDYWT